MARILEDYGQGNNSGKIAKDSHHESEIVTRDYGYVITFLDVPS